MAIKQPSELSVMNKKVRLLIAGYPGICKTTTALSAPKPLLIDVDHGIDRVSARYRQPFVQPERYEELLKDLTVENLRDYETLVFDTGGQLLKLIAEWAKRQNPANGQRDGSLSLKGYGAVGREFESLMNRAYYELSKNVVVIFHAKEEKENEVFKLRILVEGQTKDNVWQPMDLGGFIEMQNGKRVITFANTERHFGKCCHGIPPSITIPELTPNSPNNFLTWLFAQVNENIRKEAGRCEKMKAEYMAVMSEVDEIIGSIIDGSTAKKASEKIKKLNHILTSLSESQSLFKKKLEELGLKYDKGTGDYLAKSESTTHNTLAS